MKLAETVPYNVAKEKIESAILNASPERNIYTGKPKKDARLFFGYNFAFENFLEVLINLKPVSLPLVSELANDEEQGMDMYPQRLGFRFEFTE